MANPFLAPDLERPRAEGDAAPPPRRLGAAWARCTRRSRPAPAAGSASMELPPVPEFDRLSPKGLEIMVHQSRFLESVRDGHRTFLLADEPGLGKTAESVLAASVADAYPLLAVVPNVVKMNWAREVERWTPQRRATVIHGDGEDVDAFADVVHRQLRDPRPAPVVAQLARAQGHGRRRGALHQEPQLAALAERARARRPHPRAGAQPAAARPHRNAADQRRRGLRRDLALPRLDDGREARPAADGAARRDRPDARRQGVLPRGARRRDLDGDRAAQEEGCRRRPARQAHRRPARRARRRVRPLDPPGRARARRRGSPIATAASSRRAATAGSRPAKSTPTSCASSRRTSSTSRRPRAPARENVFTMVRKIGQAKALLAADYAVQLQRSVGKVVFFAKHIDVMDAAEAHFAAAGLRTVSMRGDQTTPARQQAIDAFNNDPGRRHRGLLAHRGRRRREHAGGVERRARRAVVDGRRADAGDRPRAPHRPGRAGHGVAHHRRAHDRHEDRRAHRLEAGPRRARARRRGRRPAVERLRAARRRSCTCCGRRSARTERDAASGPLRGIG